MEKNAKTKKPQTAQQCAEQKAQQCADTKTQSSTKPESCR